MNFYVDWGSNFIVVASFIIESSQFYDNELAGTVHSELYLAVCVVHPLFFILYSLGYVIPLDITPPSCFSFPYNDLCAGVGQLTFLS